MAQAFVVAFQSAEGAWSLENFHRMSADMAFREALRNTLLLIVAIVPAQVVLALMMALVIQTGLRGSSLFLYTWAIPLGISDLAAGIVWLAIFTERGYLNSLLSGLGILSQPISWLSYESPQTLFVAVVVAEIWRATAIVMVVLVAGLQMIPRDYLEAAEVFGAGPWQRVRHVILPLIRPSLQVALILRTILAFQVFAVVIALGGRNLPVLAGEAYFWYGAYRNAGVAAAYAVLILALSVLSTILYLRTLRVRQEEMAL